ncbi:MAG: YdeI/OmpD-associated family protein [Acidimicrobiia bacterium]
MDDEQRFRAVIHEARRGGAVVEVPPEVVEALGGKGRIPVQATFDGIPYRGSIVSMGGRPILGMLKAIREELGKSFGDTVEVMVAVDTEERKVTVPARLQAALAENPSAAEAFEKLSYTHQREYVQWIEEAKRAETQERRIRQTIERLLER